MEKRLPKAPISNTYDDFRRIMRYGAERGGETLMRKQMQKKGSTDPKETEPDLETGIFADQGKQFKGGFVECCFQPKQVQEKMSFDDFAHRCKLLAKSIRE